MTILSPALVEFTQRELRYRLALRTIVHLEHHDDGPVPSRRHWQKNMTDPFCPGCIAQKALDSHSDTVREAGRAEGGEPGAGAVVQPDPELTGYSGEAATALDKPESSRPPASPMASGSFLAPEPVFPDATEFCNAVLTTHEGGARPCTYSQHHVGPHSFAVCERCGALADAHADSCRSWATAQIDTRIIRQDAQECYGGWRRIQVEALCDEIDRLRAVNQTANDAIDLYQAGAVQHVTVSDEPKGTDA